MAHQPGYSTFTCKGQSVDESVDVDQVGRVLAVLYVLEVSVRKAGSNVRITGQLIDAFTGAHLWADCFDGLLEDAADRPVSAACKAGSITRRR